MSQLGFQTTVTDDLAAIVLTGELDVAGAARLEREIDRVLATGDGGRLVLDLSGLEFMDSTGLRLVVLADGRARERGWTLVLVRGNEDVHRVFELTRMTERLTFVGSLDELA